MLKKGGVDNKGGGVSRRRGGGGRHISSKINNSVKTIILLASRPLIFEKNSPAGPFKAFCLILLWPNSQCFPPAGHNLAPTLCRLKPSFSWLEPWYLKNYPLGLFKHSHFIILWSYFQHIPCRKLEKLSSILSRFKLSVSWLLEPIGKSLSCGAFQSLVFNFAKLSLQGNLEPLNISLFCGQIYFWNWPYHSMYGQSITSHKYFASSNYHSHGFLILYTWKIPLRAIQSLPLNQFMVKFTKCYLWDNLEPLTNTLWLKLSFSWLLEHWGLKNYALRGFKRLPNSKNFPCGAIEHLSQINSNYHSDGFLGLHIWKKSPCCAIQSLLFNHVVVRLRQLAQRGNLHKTSHQYFANSNYHSPGFLGLHIWKNSPAGHSKNFV